MMPAIRAWAQALRTDERGLNTAELMGNAALGYSCAGGHLGGASGSGGGHRFVDANVELSRRLSELRR